MFQSPIQVIRSSSMVSRSSPSPQNQDLTEVHGCRWKWCRCTFSTYPDLVQHVLSDHVRTFVPIRRQDLSMLRRADEGVGESLSLPDFLLSQSGYNEGHNSFQSARARENPPQAEPLSSLPSPPVSSPTSLSPGLDDDELLQPASSTRHSLQRSQSPPNANSKKPFIASPLIAENKQLISPRRRHSPPTFTSLSSPTGSQTDEMMIDPPTPTFDSLVAKAISANKERNNPRSIPPSPSRPLYVHNPSSQDSSASSNNSSSESLGSHESTGSHEFVEQQLTQRMDIDEDTIDRDYSSPGGSYNQDLPVPGIIPGIANERTTPMPVRRQTWYGTLPARRSSLGFGVGSETRSSTKLRSSNSTPLQLSKATADVVPERAFRSGTSQVSPSVNDIESPAFSQSQPYSQTDSQSFSQASSLEYASYPLQTQAPYQSQSYSP